MAGMRWTALGMAAIAVLGLGTAAAAAAPAAPVRTHHPVNGDFDGDGRRDLALGAPGGDRVRITYTHALRHGSHTGFVTGAAPHPVPMDFGASLALGDFNGDGFGDLAVGAPSYRPKHQHGGFGNPEPQGAVFLFLGSASGLHQQPLALVGPYDGDEPYSFGSDLAVGDPNHDGFADLAVTIPLEDPQVDVFYGSHSGLSAADETPIDDSSVGNAVAFGDINGDRHTDLIVGSSFDFTDPVDGDPGALVVHYGTATGVSPHAHLVHGRDVGVKSGLGSAVNSGDINHDGFDDVVAGALGDRQNGTNRFPGSVVVLFGSRHGLHASDSVRIQASKIYSGTATGDEFGAAIAVADITGDGRADVVIGAPGKNVDGVVNAGAAYFLAGTSHGLATAHPQQLSLRTPGVPGSAHRNGRFGAALFLTQLAGNRHLDLLAGAPNESRGASHGGFVVRMLGTPSGLTGQHAKGYGDNARGDHLGTAVR